MEKKDKNAKLVTGNIKDFPVDKRIVTPRELLKLIEKQLVSEKRKDVMKRNDLYTRGKLGWQKYTDQLKAGVPAIFLWRQKKYNKQIT